MLISLLFTLLQGEPFIAYVHPFTYSSPKCVSSLSLIARETLTGAEEIDILYSPCPTGTLSLLHYRNDGSLFTFGEDLSVSRLLVASRLPIHIEAVHLNECSSVSSNHCKGGRRRRKHRGTKTTHGREEQGKSRRKREVDVVTLTRAESPHAISTNLTIERGETLVIEGGARVLFDMQTSIQVFGSLRIEGTEDSPVFLSSPSSSLSWDGIHFHPEYDVSNTVLRYVNITNAVNGIVVEEGAQVPSMNETVVDSANIGFNIQLSKGGGLQRLRRSTSVNSQTAGFVVHGEGDIQFEECIASASSGHGFFLVHSGPAYFYSSSSYSNSLDGILSNGSTSLLLQDSLVGANGAAGIRVVRPSSTSRFSLHLIASRVTNHFYDPAILVDTAHNMDFLFENSQIYENANGALVFGGTTSESEVRIIGSRWTKNSGPTIHFGLVQGGSFLVDGNIFIDNRGKQQKEATIEIMTDSDEETTVVMNNNTWSNNTMETLVRFVLLGGKEPKTTLSHNIFDTNTATTVVDASMLSSSALKLNSFDDPNSSCEVASMLPVTQDNTFSDRVKTRECQGEEGATLRPIVTPSTVQEFPSISQTYNQIRTSTHPYQVKNELEIGEDKIVVIDEGNNIEFVPGIGMTVKGKLYINGTSTAPIELYGKDGIAWDGIKVEKGGHLYLSNVVIRDPNIGLLLNSDVVSLNNVTFIRSLKHAVQLGPDFCSTQDCSLNLGGSTIRDSFGAAFVADRREKARVTVSNGSFIDNYDTSIEFHAPNGEVTLRDINIRNGGGIGIWLEMRGEEGIDGIRLERIRIEDEERGEAGILVTTTKTHKFELLDSTFERNTVPSIIVSMEKSAPFAFFNFSSNIFTNNSGVVSALSCNGCASGQVSYNKWLNNNANSKETSLYFEVTRKPEQEDIPSILFTTNSFEGNGGESSLAFSSSPLQPLSAIVSNNSFTSNNNSRGVIVTDTPYSSLHYNSFSNPHSQFDVEIMFKDEGLRLNATHNTWTTDPPSILDGRQDKNKGFVNLGEIPVPSVSPSLFPPIDTSDCLIVNYCSGHGRCIGPSLCQCYPGWSSPSCSVSTPTCVSNCSNHGLCVGSQCICEIGWIGQSCETATCTGVGDCSGHGVCVGKDECECAEGWGGPTCAEEACEPASCIHGTCSGTVCGCEDGWTGPTCSFPLCSSNCSLNGQCVSPDTCGCFPDFTGSDCETCDSDACSPCNIPCAHGRCAEDVCVCDEGWTGSSCDVCSHSSLCTSRSSLLFLLPPTADPSIPGQIVSVHGVQIPSSPRYSCVFGSLSSIGRRVSSSLVRCPLPFNLPIGKHAFTLWPEGVAGPIPSYDRKPLHFTAFSSCSPSSCQGECLGPICMCRSGRSGPLCQFAQVDPLIDKRFISNKETISAVEGTPYIVQLPTIPSSVYSLHTDAEGLHLDESRSLLIWDSPLGRKTPYNVDVTLSTPGGESSIMWNLSVPISYSAVVDSVKVENGTRVLSVMGRVVGNTTKRTLPVEVTLSRSDGKQEKKLVSADYKGVFTVPFIPSQESERYSVMAGHPGEENSDTTPTSVEVKGMGLSYEKSVTIDSLKQGINYKLEGTDQGREWTARVLYPAAVSIEQLHKEATNSITIIYRLDEDVEGNLVVLLDNGLDRLIASHSIATSRFTHLSSSPSSILFHLNAQSISQPIQLKLYPGGSPITSPLSFSFSTTPPPFYVLSSSPALDDFQSYSQSSSPIVLWLQSYGGRGVTGTLTVLQGSQPLLDIPYTIDELQSPFTLRLCLRDSTSLAPSTPSSSTDAEITLTRIYNNAVTVRQATINGAPEDFDMVPGYYQLSITSNDHKPVREMIYMTSSNSSFCTQLSPLRRDLLPVWNTRSLSVDTTSFRNDSPLPVVLFTPSTFLSGTHEVEISVMSSNESIISILPPTFGVIRMEIDRGIQNGETVKVTLTVNPVETECDGLLVPIPFLHSTQRSTFTGETYVIVLKRNITQSKDTPRICSSSSSSSLPLSFRTQVQCNCAAGARAKCREKYRGTAACGGGWRVIPDDTVSTEVLGLFLSLVAECRSLDISLEQVHESTKCISSLESVCPLNRQIAVLPIQGNAFNTDPVSSPSVNVLLPILRVLDLQSVSLASLYNEFFASLENVFPSSNFSSMTQEDFATFFESISDSSQQGQWISEEESSHIEAGEQLVSLWNETMSEWRGGKIHPFEENPQQFINFTSAKRLVVAADKLKSLARQQGAANPFTLLHEYVGRVLSSAGEESSEECAIAYVYIDTPEVEEDHQFTVRINVKNERSDNALDNVELTLDLVRDDSFQTAISFRIGPFIYTGISSLGGTASLGPYQSFEATWTVLAVSSSRLVRPAHYQAIITLSFLSSGRSTLMRLNSPRITILPRLSMKILYFVRSGTAGTNDDALVSIINTGYRPLEGVRVESADITVLDNEGQPSPFAVDSVTIKETSPVSLEGTTRSTSLIGELPPIESGHSLLMAVNVSSAPQSRLSSIHLTTSLDGTYLKLDDSRSFSVVAASSSSSPSQGFLVSPLGQPSPFFLFSPQDAKLQNIAHLNVLQSRWEPSLTSGKQMIRVIAAMNNPESPDYASSLWGQVSLPSLPQSYQLLRVREVGSASGPNGRGVGGPAWITNQSENRVLNFIDTGSPPRGGNINYEFLFGDPRDFDNPIFAQDIYRIQVLPEFWPEPGSVAGEIKGSSPLNHSLTYALYSSSNDDTWSVDENTGEIILEKPLKQGEEKCYTLVAQDSEGLHTSVPIAINTGMALRECRLIDDVSSLTPLTHSPSTVSHAYPTTSFTRLPPTLPPLYPTTDVYSPTTSQTMEPPVLSTTTRTTEFLYPTTSSFTYPPIIIHYFTTASTPSYTEEPHEEQSTTPATLPPITPDQPLSTIPSITDFPTPATVISSSEATLITVSPNELTPETTTTEEVIHTVTVDETPEPTTIIIPWRTTSKENDESTPYTSLLPGQTPVSTSSYNEYTTETTVWAHSSEATLASLTPMQSTTPSISTTTSSSEPSSSTDQLENWSTLSISPDSSLPSITPFPSFTPPLVISTISSDEYTIAPNGETTEASETTNGMTEVTYATEITTTETEVPFTIDTMGTEGVFHTTTMSATSVLEACRLKGTAPIWGLICDLSKTLRHH